MGKRSRREIEAQNRADWEALTDPSWDEYALRQRVVATHSAAADLRADLARSFPADLVPRRLFQAAEQAADVLAEALADLDARHYAGQHRRPDAALDVAQCNDRDDTVAVYGNHHHARHGLGRHPRHRAAMRAEARRVPPPSDGPR